MDELNDCQPFISRYYYATPAALWDTRTCLGVSSKIEY